MVQESLDLRWIDESPVSSYENNLRLFEVLGKHACIQKYTDAMTLSKFLYITVQKKEKKTTLWVESSFHGI